MALKDDRYTLDDQGLLVEKVGHWARRKLELVTDYVYASGGARSHWPNRAYIDVFCGPGRSLIRDTTEFIDGSPVAAFKKAKALTGAVHHDQCLRCLPRVIESGRDKTKGSGRSRYCNSGSREFGAAADRKEFTSIRLASRIPRSPQSWHAFVRSVPATGQAPKRRHHRSR